MPVQRRLRSLILAAAGLSALVLAGPGSLRAASLAATETPPAAAPAPSPEEAAAAEAAKIQQDLADKRSQRQRDLSTILQLTPVQTVAFDAYVASQALPPPSAQAAAETPAARLARQRALRQRRAAGQKAFYAALAPGQREVFDALNRVRAADIDLVRQRIAAQEAERTPRRQPKNSDIHVAAANGRFPG